MHADGYRPAVGNLHQRVPDHRIQPLRVDLDGLAQDDRCDRQRQAHGLRLGFVHQLPLQRLQARRDAADERQQGLETGQEFGLPLARSLLAPGLGAGGASFGFGYARGGLLQTELPPFVTRRLQLPLPLAECGLDAGIGDDRLTDGGARTEDGH